MSGTQWRVLDLPPGMVVEHLADAFPGTLTVSGLRDRTAYAAWINPDGDLREIPIPPAAAEQGSARVVRSSDLGVLGVCGSTGLWGRRDDANGHGQVHDVPSDENGTEAAWLWVTAGDGNLQATAAYPTKGGHELRPLDADAHQLMPVEQRLVTATPLENIHVAAFAGRVTAAGPITDPHTLTVWWATSAVLDPEEYRPDPLPWLYDAFEGPPACITGGIDWGSLSFFAGVTTDGTVALWDVTGAIRETTDVPVDLDDPVALIAEIEGWGSWGEGEDPGGLAAFAVKTPAGNVLSFRGGTYDMPPGRIRSVVLNRGFDRPRGFALIDEVVHVVDLEY